jgi:uncharacterized protein Yka (UPF0111/DUF47 family)
LNNNVRSLFINRLKGEFFVFKYLWPQEAIFFDNFETQARLLNEAAMTLLKIASNENKIHDKITDIKRLETEADKITHATLEALHKTFITPFDRDDIHKLTSLLDDVIDEIEDTADCLLIYNIEQLTPYAKVTAEILAACTQEVTHLVKYLRERKDIKTMISHFELIGRGKNEANQVTRNALGQLFEQEPDARMIIKWKEIYEHLEKSIDLCDDVANVIEGIILEYS